MKQGDILYPNQAAELAAMLDADQAEKKALARAYFNTKDQNSYNIKMSAQAKHARERAQRMLQIVEEVGELSVSNIGTKASVAISVLTVHSTLRTMKKILCIGLVSFFITCLLLAAIFKTSVQGIGIVILLVLAVFFGLMTWLTLFAALKARPLDDISTNIWSEIFNLIF